MTYLKEIKSKNGRALSKRLNHSGSGILAAALFGCFGLLASCTAGDDSLDNGTDTGANVKTASNVSVKQSSSDRITLFKTSGTRAVTRSADLTMPDQPTVPDDHITADWGSTPTQQGSYFGGKTIYVPANTEASLNIWDQGGNDCIIYVAGTLTLTNGMANKVIILDGGKLIATGTSPAGKEFYCYNTADDAYTFKSGGYTLTSTSIFMTKGDYVVQGEVQGQLYVKGTLSGSSYHQSTAWSSTGPIVVANNVSIKGAATVSGGSLTVNESLTASTVKINYGAEISVGCGLTCTSTTSTIESDNSAALDIEGTLSIYENGFVNTPTTEISGAGDAGNSIINISGYNSFLNLGKVVIRTYGNTEINVLNDGLGLTKPTIVTKEIRINGGKCITAINGDWNQGSCAGIYCFNFPNSGGLNLYFEDIQVAQGGSWPSYLNTGTKGTGNYKTYALNTNITIGDNTNVPPTPTSCGSNTGNSGDDNPTTPDHEDPEPTTPTIDDIADIETIDHEHVLSATCVDWNSTNNKVYVSWHARGTGQAGCLEVFDHSTAEKPSLVSYMQAWSGSNDEKYSQNDEMHYIDYNHCMYDSEQNRLYAVGNSNAVGGHLSYIDLGSDGTFDDSKEYDEYNSTEDITNGGVLKYIALNHGTQKSCDGNCIIRQGNDFLVASTSGFETFDASTLKSTNFAPTIDGKNEGKGKHIATDGTNILTLNYDRVIDKNNDENEDTPVQAIVRSYSASDHTFSFANTVIDKTETIAPNDGKNTIAVDGNYAYVCLSEYGLVIYDLNGKKINSFVGDKVTVQGVEVAGGLCNGVAVDDDYIYVAYGSLGLYVFDKASVLNGETMEPVASYKCSKSCNYIKVVDRDSYHYIYIAYGENGLKVCRIKKKNA